MSVAAGSGSTRAQIRKRGGEAWHKHRAASRLTPRVYPRWVDMGHYSTERAVRYDRGRDKYDLRDALLVAYGGAERAVKTVSKDLGADFGLASSAFMRIKWSDCDPKNGGKGRVVTDAGTCADVIRRSLCGHPRAALLVDQVAHWFATQAKADTPPDLLQELAHSEHGAENEHRGL